MCPLTFLLLDLIVSAPTTSVSGEREFSEMKLNLSRLRSSLQELEVQLNSSMFINLNNHAPSWSDDPEGVKRFLDASIERFLNSDTKRRVLSNRYSKFSKDPVKHIRTAKQTTMNSCFSVTQDSIKRRREDAETDSEVDEEAAEEGTAYEEPCEAGNVDETRDEKQAKKTKKSKKSKKFTTKKLSEEDETDEQGGDENDLQVEDRVEAKEFAFEAYEDPSLSPAQVVIIVQQLETESARAVAQQQLCSLDTSCDRSIGRAGAHHG